jgi:hypothetical protein
MCSGLRARRYRRKLYGIDHWALTFNSLEALLKTYDRLKKHGITPVWAINHGPTTSLYYEDPDGIRLEFQTENFPTAKATTDFLGGSVFAQNPIGVNIDADYLMEQFRSGIDPADLLNQGAGTRPGTKQSANKKTINWRTL